MPNWTHSIISFKHETPERFQAILDYVLDDNNNIDFNKIIPAPKALFQDNVPSTSNLENYLFRLRQKDESKFNDSLSKLSESRKTEFINSLKAKRPFYINHSEFQPKPLSDDEKLMLTSFYETGYFSWYDWNTANWGTKWNASETDVDEKRQRIEFDTAWDMPRPILQEIANKFDIDVTGVAIFEGDEPENIYVEPESYADDED